MYRFFTKAAPVAAALSAGYLFGLHSNYNRKKFIEQEEESYLRKIGKDAEQDGYPLYFLRLLPKVKIDNKNEEDFTQIWHCTSGQGKILLSKGETNVTIEMTPGTAVTIPPGSQYMTSNESDIKNLDIAYHYKPNVTEASENIPDKAKFTL